MARLAALVARNLDGRLDTLRRFVEGDLQVIAKIRAALRSAAATLPAEHLADTEDVAESAKDVFEAGKDGGIESAGCGAAKARMAEAVVHVALVGIGEHGVGFRRLLESIFGRLVAGIAIRMVFERQPAIGALDFLVGRGAGDLQDFVVVALAHALATFTIAGRSRRSPST